MVRAAKVERIGVGDIEGSHLRRQLSARTSGPPRRIGVARIGMSRVVDLVIDVGDVDDQRRFIALMLEEALEQTEYDERTGIADVDTAVDGGPARVDTDLAGIARF